MRSSRLNPNRRLKLFKSRLPIIPVGGVMAPNRSRGRVDTVGIELGLLSPFVLKAEEY